MAVRVFIIFLIFVYSFFVILVPFEILLHYLNNDNSCWLKEDGQWIIDNVFGEKFMV